MFSLACTSSHAFKSDFIEVLKIVIQDKKKCMNIYDKVTAKLQLHFIKHKETVHQKATILSKNFFPNKH